MLDRDLAQEGQLNLEGVYLCWGDELSGMK